MRIVNSLLCLLMLLFAGVQYNDPDGPLWIAIYAVPGLATGLYAATPNLASRSKALRIAYALGTLACLIGVLFFWPRTPNFWRQDVWWETETAREGMGMMIAALAMMTAAVSVWRDARREPEMVAARADAAESLEAED